MHADFVESFLNYIIYVDLPGVRPEDVDVHLQGPALFVRAQRKHFYEDSSLLLRSLERSFGKAERSFRLPWDCDLGKIQVQFCGGVLTIKICKIIGGKLAITN